MVFVSERGKKRKGTAVCNICPSNNLELLAPRVFFDFVGVIDLSLSWWCTILCWMVQEKASPSLKSSRNPHGTYCRMPKLLISWRLRFELLTVQNPWEPGTSGIAILQALGRLVLETLTWRLRQRIWTLIFHNKNIAISISFNIFKQSINHWKMHIPRSTVEIMRRSL